jgi:NADPH:quinone reductase-like Zn-dependent oxidoreductase
MPIGSGLRPADRTLKQNEKIPMKSYHVNSGTSIAGLVVREHDEPAPGPNEVVVRVKTTSLNFRELMILRDNYPLPIKPDVVPVSID